MAEEADLLQHGFCPLTGLVVRAVGNCMQPGSTVAELQPMVETPEQSQEAGAAHGET